MSRYVITTKGQQYETYRFEQTIIVGWDAYFRRFFLIVHAEDTNIHSHPKNWHTKAATFPELIEAVKRHNRWWGIRGLGSVGRQLRSIEHVLLDDQKNNVPHDEVIEGTAEAIPDLKQLMA